MQDVFDNLKNNADMQQAQGRQGRARKTSVNAPAPWRSGRHAEHSSSLIRTSMVQKRPAVYSLM